ncbi:unnamed protein product [Lupinus luteus]|uniref:RRM domain-containing protein n=1 Tax=Lupinus luteus TaxID=3873 RepID=A0AAV1WB92_LUPLU
MSSSQRVGNGCCVVLFLLLFGNPSACPPLRDSGHRKHSNTHPHPGISSTRPPLRDSTTFFFTNFPTDHDAKEMWEIFQKWGKVVDVVIPSRLDKYGKKFGFVRFQGVQNSKQMVQKLDRIWIGLHKIWVNLPKFQRSQWVSGFHSSDKPRKEIDNKPIFKLRDGHNFVEVVKNGSQNSANSNLTITLTKTVNPSLEPAFEFVTTEESPIWLRNSYIGTLPEQVDSGGLKEKLLLDGFFSVQLIPLGGRTVLLRAEEEGEMKALLCDECAWFENKFVAIRKWKPTDAVKGRFFWIRCFGVPLHAWEEIFFEKIALLFESFMSINDCTIFKKNLEYGRVFIASSSWSMVDKAIRVKINGVIFDIHVPEERASCCHHISSPNSVSPTCSSGDGSLSESGYSWLDQIYEENAGNWASEEEEDVVAVGKQLPPSQATQAPDPKLLVQIGPGDLPLPAHPQSLQSVSVLAPQPSTLNVGVNVDSLPNHGLNSVESFTLELSP